jgi:hypothetical protein
MAAATIVMMRTSCQQTKIADSLARITIQQEDAKFLAAKRELQRAASVVIFAMADQGGDIEAAKSKEDCVQISRKLCERMDLPDNCYLLQHPKEAARWDALRTKFGMFALPNYFDRDIPTQWGTNMFNSKTLTDKQVVEMLRETCHSQVGEFMEIYSALGLSELRAAKVTK